MNFALFESMAESQAREHLRNFLDTEQVAVAAMLPIAGAAGLATDFSLASVAPFLRWILARVQAVRTPLPATVPDWIRDSQNEGVVDFPHESKCMILRAAYYFGESFVRCGAALSWTIGDPEYVEKNMPVVAGFKSGLELAPVMVCENIFARVLGFGTDDSHVGTVVRTWVEMMP